MLYRASENPLVRGAEALRGIVGFEDGEQASVILPNSSDPIAVPTADEMCDYWETGPSAFSSPERFEEVRAYMRHYFVDADSAERRWEQRAAVEAEIAAAIDEKRRP